MSSQYLRIATPDGDTLTFAVPLAEVSTVISSWQRRGAKVSLGARTTPFSSSALSGVDIARPFTPVSARAGPEALRIGENRPLVDRPHSRRIAAAIQEQLPPSPTPKDISVVASVLNADETEISESDMDSLFNEGPLDDDGGD